MAASHSREAPPAAFEAALVSLREASLRPELELEETGAPQRLAPYSAAFLASVFAGSNHGDDEEPTATGRLVLLHDPAGHEAWHGNFRLVTFVRAELDPETVTDPLLARVAWSWLTEALDSHGLAYTAPSGTVTRVASESFGALATRPAGGEIEVRASWTPLDEVRGHMEAWSEVLCTAAGLPPLPPGVVSIPHRRGVSGR